MPSVVVMRPRSDLCWQGQQNSAVIVRMANCSEVKTSAISDVLEHLRMVKMERAQHKAVCEECKESVRAYFTTNREFTPPYSCTPSNTNDIKVHYAFDYAQEVHYPSDPLAARSHLLSDTPEVHCVWCELRGTALAI